MEIVFNEAELKQVQEFKSRYPESKAAIMPVLWLAQKKFGWLSEDVQKYVAEIMDLPYSHVMGVASFYTMYFKKPMGQYHIQVCTNVSCMLRGGEELYRHMKSRYRIGNNERTADGKFSLEEVECMGACSGAPMMVVNEDYHENLTLDQADTILNALP